MNLDKQSAHNQNQIKYYSSHVKPRMRPKETAYIKRQIDEVLEVATINKNDRVLEVGCGMGRITLHLAKREINISGLELTPFLLEKLREQNNNEYDIPLYCADITDFPKELTAQFDQIVGFFVLHHFYDLSACFTAMEKMLKPGGRITFLEPNAYNPLYYIQVLITPGMTWKGDKGIIKMRRKIIKNALEAGNFKNFNLSRYGVFPPFISNTKWGRKLESFLEKIPFLKPFLPFQLFSATKGN